ncbi:MAG: hypothetical protein L0H70_05825 [Xanthomonadales bacterium]|nr:hypothetical protein [Xanthomonadales bacterium]
MSGARGALQWRLLLLWTLGLLLPTAVVTLPLWLTLAQMFDHVVPASAWAQQFNGLELDGFAPLLAHAGALQGAGLAGGLLALALSPWLTGMVIACGRRREPLDFAALLLGGLREYGRMLRVMLWAMLPLALALLVALVALGTAYNHAAQALLEAQANSAYRWAWWIAGSVFVLFHVVIETGRAQFIADASLRSAWHALGRGLDMLLHRPLASLGIYLGTSLIGYALLLGLIAWRVQVIAASVPAFIGACLLVQLMVLVLAWMRSARLLGLAKLAQPTAA